jgi:glutamyl-tRNA synthetase
MSDSSRPVRSRFAPSPTGYLHIGNLRTGLFAFAYARHHKGTFILRIEDTDRERSTDAAVQVILDAMQWLGMDADEGPFYQTDRFGRYQEILDQLLEEGKAYRCYCTKERLTELREAQMKAKAKPRYDGHCRDCGDVKEAPFCIRFKNPSEGVVTFVDQVKGSISVDNSELDDLVIARTDGTPTYNFTVVVDDYDMNITEVVRGDDHVNNTPRQINIFKALGYEPPSYAHVPMILGDDGKRYSKRHGAASVMSYKDEGYLPEALLSYLIRLGWSHGDQEIFTRTDIEALFDADHLNSSPAAFDIAKLQWVNQHFIKEASVDALLPIFKEQLGAMDVGVEDESFAKAVIALQHERAKTMKEMAEKSVYFFNDVTEYDEKAARKFLNEQGVAVLTAVHEKLSALDSWLAEPIHQVVLDVAEALQLKLGKVAQPIRVAITGNTVSPPIDATLELLGRDVVLHRMSQALAL